MMRKTEMIQKPNSEKLELLSNCKECQYFNSCFYMPLSENCLKLNDSILKMNKVSIHISKMCDSHNWHIGVYRCNNNDNLNYILCDTFDDKNLAERLKIEIEKHPSNSNVKVIKEFGYGKNNVVYRVYAPHYNN